MNIKDAFNKCHFVSYGDAEKRCIHCGFIINNTDNDLLEFINQIMYTGEFPVCAYEFWEGFRCGLNYDLRGKE